jgi:hypothetical protein
MRENDSPDMACPNRSRPGLARDDLRSRLPWRAVSSRLLTVHILYSASPSKVILGSIATSAPHHRKRDHVGPRSHSARINERQRFLFLDGHARGNILCVQSVCEAPEHSLIGTCADGPGSVETALPKLLEALGAKRALIVTGKSLLEKVQTILSSILPFTYLSYRVMS